MGKTIYKYRPDTGEHYETREARESPLEPGVYLMPAYSTEVAPPEAKEGFANCFIDGKWVQAEDHRGEPVFNAAGMQVPRARAPLGPLPKNLTATPKPGRNYSLIEGEWVEDYRRETVFGADGEPLAPEDIPLGPLPPTMSLERKPQDGIEYKLVANAWVVDEEVEAAKEQFRTEEIARIALEEAAAQAAHAEERSRLAALFDELEVLKAENAALKAVLIEEDPTREAKIEAKKPQDGKGITP